MSEVIVISNRLPLSVVQENGVARVTRSSGGLVTALEPILREQGGTWIGNGGTNGDPAITRMLEAEGRKAGFECRPVYVSEEEERNFYEGFSNQVLWPLFHDFIGECRFEPEYWEAYRRVNGKFADEAMTLFCENPQLWVHDYQLMCVGAELRDRGCEGRIAFFLHTPFPSHDVYAKMPWRRELLESMLHYDLIGLQTERDVRNLVSCIRRLVPGAVVTSDHAAHLVAWQGRKTVIRDFPISIDFDEFSEAASLPQIEARVKDLQRELATRQVIFGVDRQDYTKGIPHRLRAFGELLRRKPEMIGNVTLVQVVVPSRQNIPGYEALKSRIEHLVASINGEYTQPGWVPIHYIHRPVPREELVALYRVADVALVTPLKDGMNLVAKEFCASRIHDRGVLVLSEFAGAAAEMDRGALIVNPFDVIGVADALEQALEMPVEEQMERMHRLRRLLRYADVHRWVRDFLRAMEPAMEPAA
jgi:trehalose 6-phosphate synthase/phosphatase